MQDPDCPASGRRPVLPRREQQGPARPALGLWPGVVSPLSVPGSLSAWARARRAGPGDFGSPLYLITHGLAPRSATARATGPAGGSLKVWPCRLCWLGRRPVLPPHLSVPACLLAASCARAKNMPAGDRAAPFRQCRRDSVPLSVCPLLCVTF
ncbi:unnamed protein product [Amoebophrya sp. A120]|nr:unnamed protein product [Amoebophrya sp. A120]|eukprot:GSA120T00008764001.1